MSGDPRIGSDESGFVQIADADDGAPQTALAVPTNALARVDKIKVENSASASVNLELYDDEDGTSAGNVSDQRDVLEAVGSGNSRTVEGPWRVFEEDVLVATENGGQDDLVSVTVYGEVLTDLLDMTTV